MWVVYAFLSAITAALVAVFGKLGLKEIDSVLATTLRSIIMMVFLVLTAFFLGKFRNFSLSSLGTRTSLLIIAAGVCGAMSWLFYFLALKYGLATHVVAIDRLSIIFVLVFAALFLGEGVGWKMVVGGVLMAAGAILISL